MSEWPVLVIFTDMLLFLLFDLCLPYLLRCGIKRLSCCSCVVPPPVASNVCLTLLCVSARIALNEFHLRFFLACVTFAIQGRMSPSMAHVNQLAVRRLPLQPGLISVLKSCGVRRKTSWTSAKMDLGSTAETVEKNQTKKVLGANSQEFLHGSSRVEPFFSCNLPHLRLEVGVL